MVAMPKCFFGAYRIGTKQVYDKISLSYYRSEYKWIIKGRRILSAIISIVIIAVYAFLRFQRFQAKQERQKSAARASEKILKWCNKPCKITKIN